MYYFIHFFQNLLPQFLPHSPFGTVFRFLNKFPKVFVVFEHYFSRFAEVVFSTVLFYAVCVLKSRKIGIS